MKKGYPAIVWQSWGPNQGSMASHTGLLPTSASFVTSTEHVCMCQAPVLVLIYAYFLNFSSIIVCINILKVLKCPAINTLVYLCPVFLRFTWLQNSPVFGGEEEWKENICLCALGEMMSKRIILFWLCFPPNAGLRHDLFSKQSRFTESLASFYNCPVSGDLHQGSILLTPGHEYLLLSTLWECWQ